MIPDVIRTGASSSGYAAPCSLHLGNRRARLARAAGSAYRRAPLRAGRTGSGMAVQSRANSQTEKRYLREGSDIDDRRTTRQALQRQGRTAVTVFAAAIVLDNDRARAFRPFDQFETPGKGHRDPRWILLRRSDVGEPHFSRQVAESGGLSYHTVYSAI